MPTDLGTLLALREALKVGGAGSNFGTPEHPELEGKTLTEWADSKGEPLLKSELLTKVNWVKVHTSKVVAPGWWHSFMQEQLE
jgi:hypothetical protein